jgi:hypothetical protein
MKVSTKRWIVIVTSSLIGAAVLALSLLMIIAWLLLPSNARDNNNSAKRQEMVQLSYQWGQLATFPSSASNFVIKTEGNAFTRTFIGSFDAASDVVAVWLSRSLGVTEGQQKVNDDGSTTYILKMSEGAAYGEVKVSTDGTHVSFRVSWS